MNLRMRMESRFMKRLIDLNLSMEELKFFAMAIVVGCGALGPGIAMGMLVSKAMEAIGRNPEAASKIQTNMILGLAFTEALMIFALVTALIIKFV